MVSVTIDRRDGLNSAAAMKGPCRVATTANITLSGLQVIDGVQTVEGDRVLVRVQDTAQDNGIRIASTGNWERAADFRNNRDVVTGTRVYVTSGTTNANTEWFLSTDSAITIGTTSLAFTKTPLTSRLPDLVANTISVDNAAGTAREQKTFAEVVTLLNVKALNADGGFTATHTQATEPAEHTPFGGLFNSAAAANDYHLALASGVHSGPRFTMADLRPTFPPVFGRVLGF
jgi:phage-related tail fiber protein